MSTNIVEFPAASRFRVKLDAQTTQRLQRMAMLQGGKPNSIIAAIVHDVLKDDAEAHDELDLGERLPTTDSL